MPRPPSKMNGSPVRIFFSGIVVYTYDAEGKLIPARMELVRLAMPRRVYTQSHIDYVIEAIIEVFNNRNSLLGYRIVEEPPVLRHFTAKFEPIG